MEKEISFQVITIALLLMAITLCATVYYCMTIYNYDCLREIANEKCQDEGYDDADHMVHEDKFYCEGQVKSFEFTKEEVKSCIKKEKNGW